MLKRRDNLGVSSDFYYISISLNAYIVLAARNVSNENRRYYCAAIGSFVNGRVKGRAKVNFVFFKRDHVFFLIFLNHRSMQPRTKSINPR